MYLWFRIALRTERWLCRTKHTLAIFYWNVLDGFPRWAVFPTSRMQTAKQKEFPHCACVLPRGLNSGSYPTVGWIFLRPAFRDNLYAGTPPMGWSTPLITPLATSNGSGPFRGAC